MFIYWLAGACLYLSDTDDDDDEDNFDGKFRRFLHFLSTRW